MDNPNFEEEQQRIQKALNQAKKRELEEKYGALFSEGAPQVPAEIESQWLDSIDEFERQFKDARRVTVREFLGNPRFTPLEEIHRERLEAELDGVLELLSLHDISVDSVAGVSDEDMYRFVTTELMDEEIDEIKIEGMTHCFIYEEFHPNDEYDAKSCADSFLWDLFERHEEYVVLKFAKDEVCDPLGRRITREEMKNLVRSFYSCYSAFIGHTFECIGCSLGGEYATVKLHGDWSGLKAGSMEQVSHKGMSELKLKKSPYGGYDVIQINIPGLME
jgi:hypothetical protein